MKSLYVETAYVFALIPWIKYRLYFVIKSTMLLFRYKVRQVRTIAHITVLFSSPCIDWQTHVKLHVYASTSIFRPCPPASTHGRWSRTSKYLIRKKGTKMYRNICVCVNSTCVCFERVYQFISPFLDANQVYYSPECKSVVYMFVYVEFHSNWVCVELTYSSF